MAERINAKDTINGALAECFITIDGDRYNFFQAKNLEAKYEKTKTEIPILGQVNKGNKGGSLKGTGSMTIYYTTSLFRKLIYEYQETGKDFYFDIMVSNEDSTSDTGRQTIILKNCNLDDVVITKFDIDSETLEEDCNFTFEKFEMPEKFRDLDGMEA